MAGEILNRECAPVVGGTTGGGGAIGREVRPTPVWQSFGMNVTRSVAAPARDAWAIAVGTPRRLARAVGLVGAKAKPQARRPRSRVSLSDPGRRKQQSRRATWSGGIFGLCRKSVTG